MTSADWQKVIYGLVAGWVLAQFTSYVLWRWKAERVKKLLSEELYDLHKQVYRILVGCQRALQASGACVIEPSSTIAISNPIFRAYYKDAVLHLPSSKRVMYQLIHGHIDKLNDFIAMADRANQVARDEFAENGAGKKFLKAAEDFKALTSTCYVQCWMLDWHIRYQLSSRDPDLDVGTSKHKEYVDMLVQASNKAGAFVEQGRGMTPSQFEFPSQSDAFVGGFPQKGE